MCLTLSPRQEKLVLTPILELHVQVSKVVSCVAFVGICMCPLRMPEEYAVLGCHQCCRRCSRASGGVCCSSALQGQPGATRCCLSGPPRTLVSGCQGLDDPTAFLSLPPSAILVRRGCCQAASHLPTADATRGQPASRTDDCPLPRLSLGVQHGSSYCSEVTGETWSLQGSAFHTHAPLGPPCCIYIGRGGWVHHCLFVLLSLMPEKNWLLCRMSW